MRKKSSNCKNILNACNDGDILCVKKIIERSNGPISRHALPIAASHGYLDLVKFLISKNAPISYAIDSAAQYGQLEILKYFYSIGIIPTATTLAMAAESGNLPIIKYLLKIKTPTGPNIIDYAIRHGHLNVVKYLLKKVPIDDPISTAVNFNQLEILKFLINKVPIKSPYLISQARYKGYPEIVEFLLHNGVPFEEWIINQRYKISDSEYNAIKKKVLLEKSKEVGKILKSKGLPLHLTKEFTKYLIP